MFNVFHRFLVCSIGASLLTSCATITRGSTDDVRLISHPAGAEARTSYGESCVTPCLIRPQRSNSSFTVTFVRPGYRPETVQVLTTVGSGGMTGMAGNVLAGGLVGMVVDSSSGAIYDHVPNPVDVTLVPLSR